ncbi:hypothetical protein DAPPUDRAFT_320123 [Daphnia pulex]|uniref:Uncharacterized protein n=1 Tax=Daphnia pulex TaxID=6669 RepID=E9GNX2_DAPPU|nr:hypothetical protein DAPPUDRAFT_320123 [Daphnia pulex]|eukprot:EFX78828.1 hypothetical protein DAPPUDRAFT_320123 [Daphnia pulex]
MIKLEAATQAINTPTTPQEALQSNLKQPLKQTTPKEALQSKLESAPHATKTQTQALPIHKSNKQTNPTFLSSQNKQDSHSNGKMFKTYKA